MFGNTFDKKTYSYSHAKKIWREIRHRFPAGGLVSNVSDWVSAGKIPAGTPIKFDASNNTIVAYTDAQVKAASSDYSTLGINALLQEDIVVTDANTVASGTAVYAGEIYEFMYKADTLTGLKAITTIPQIIFVR